MQVTSGTTQGRHLIESDDDADPIGDVPNHPEFSELMFKDVNSIKLVINLPSNQTGVVSLEDVEYKLCIEKGKL